MRGPVWKLLLAAALLITAARAEVEKRTLVVDGTERSYYLVVPEAAKGKPAPLLMLLHGSNQDGERIIRLWQDKAEKEGIVLVAPNSLEKGGWAMREDGPVFLFAVLQAVVSATPIDRRRFYLFGHSGGAVFALDISMLESEFFAATAVHGGAWREEGHFALLPFAARKLPIAILIGDRDEFFPLAAVRKTKKALVDAGFPIELTVIPGHHHFLTPETAPDIIERSWAFLSRARLEQPPKFRPYKLD